MGIWSPLARLPSVTAHRSLVALSLLAGAAALLRLGFLGIVGRSLDAREFTEFTAAYGLCLIFAVLAGGYGSAVTRAAALLPPGSARVRPRVLVAAAMVLVPSGGWVVRAALGIGSFWPAALAVATGLAMLPLEALRGHWRADGRFTCLGVNLLLEGIARLAIATLLVTWSPRAGSGLLGILLAVLLCAQLGSMGSSPFLPAGSRLGARPGWPAHLGGFLGVAMIGAVWQQLDLLVVGRTLPAGSGAGYGGVSAVSKGLSVVFLPFAYSLLPRWTQMSMRGAPLASDVLRAIGAFWGITLLVVTAALPLSDPLVRAVYGPDFAEAAGLLPVLLLGLGIVFTMIILGQANAAVGDFRFAWPFAVAVGIEAVLLLRAGSASAAAWTTVAVPCAALAVTAPVLMHRLRKPLP